MRRRPPIATRTDTLLPDTTLFRSLREPTELTLEISGRQLLLEPVQRDGDRVHVGDFYPCSVLLNNDLSAGIPDILTGITQDVVPSPTVGWHMRQKSNHFGFYREVAREFADVAGIDPWLVHPLFRN